jgi:hypothetical protein
MQNSVPHSTYLPIYLLTYSMEYRKLKKAQKIIHPFDHRLCQYYISDPPHFEFIWLTSAASAQALDS